MEEDKKFNQDAKAFLENFIKNCESSVRLDAIQTSYFCNWAKSIMGMEHTKLPSDDNIFNIKLK